MKIVISKAAANAVLALANGPLKGGYQRRDGRWVIYIDPVVKASLEREAARRRCSISAVIIAQCKEKGNGNGT